MDDYIKREDVIFELEKQCEDCFQTGDCFSTLCGGCSINFAKNTIRRARIFDVRENLRGEWVTSNNCPDFVFCSVCKKNKDPNAMAWKKSYIKAVNGIFKFCPVCGADMRGEN